MKILLIIFVVLLIIGIIMTIWPVFVVGVAFFAAWKIYELIYFKSEKFLSIKERIRSYIDDCNELNRHIEELKDTSLEINRLDYGRGEHHDASKWNVKRTALKNQKYAPNVYNCSKTVVGSARNKPFEYVCKYFGIKSEEDTLEKFEIILNNFEAAEDGKIALNAEKESILSSIENDIPAPIKKFSKKQLEKNLGFDAIDFSTAHFPQYTFQYVSPGGNVGEHFDVVMDIENLNKFVTYLSEKIKFRKSVAGQRALMTSRLRQSIKERDNFTCKYCGVSVEKEPHLLLEIDHIVPVSKGGMTTEDNLQTLCWKCNRSKGSKM
ncbi:MAG: HNH endonuclease [Lachnospiraceae bacterium]|nr:HNH endonuclease [Lachnospiraceae bacterium]